MKVRAMSSFTYSAVHSNPCRFKLATSSSNFFFIEEFQWFLIELSDRPLKCRAISAHLLPKCWCRMNKRRFSSFVQGFLLIAGLRWLCHLRRNIRIERTDLCWFSPFSALLSHATFQFFGNQTPLPCAVVSHEFDHFLVFFVGPRTFGDRRVQKAFPTMLTLSIGASISDIMRNPRPIFHSAIRMNEIFQAVILERREMGRTKISSRWSLVLRLWSISCRTSFSMTKFVWARVDSLRDPSHHPCNYYDCNLL